MKRQGQPLTASFVRSVKRPGRYGDGRGSHGLSLLVKGTKNGRVSRSWSQRIIDPRTGRPTSIGLGSYPRVTLSQARKMALHNRRELDAGRDPRGGGLPTLEAATEKVIALHRPNWKPGSRTEHQWRQWHRDYIAPAIGDRLVSEVTTADVLRALTPIWSTRPVVARRVRERLSLVFRWAMSQGYRPDDPAGPDLLSVLPKQSNGKQHHQALPHGAVPAAIRKVRESTSTLPVRLCIEFVALTAARHGEARLAQWPEIDFDTHWNVPPDRMKAGREHRVPLSGRALEVLAEARAVHDGSGLIFPMNGKAINASTIGATFRRLDAGTAHGLRSAFRSWCADEGIPRETAEAALAHQVGSAVELAYQRSDVIERRRPIMERWGAYLTAQPF